ncbi:MAG: DUF4239 domain-containing protein [Candidatus Eremiobacteraeota bacterium]|nr:DUF4239 domain-containing protein [Candidatus Eremiobacteraeota bacterium]
MILQHLETRDLIASRTLKWFAGLIALGVIAAVVEQCKDPAFVDRLINVPAPVLLAVAISACLVFVGTVQRYLHCRFSEQDFVKHNEVGGFIVALVGTLYAVVLGFLTVVTWQHFSDARQLVSQEASAAADTWHTAVGLPPTRRARIREDVLDYSKLMVDSEWARMRSGAFDRHGDVIVMDALSAAEAFAPSNWEQANAQSATVGQLVIVHDIRQRRLSDNSSGLSPFEWLVLAIGAFCVIGFCWLFGLSNKRIHLLMTSAVTIVTVSTLVLLFELQYPFRSSIGISSADWSAALGHIQLMQSGAQMDMRM